MPGTSLAQGLLLPDLKLEKVKNSEHSGVIDIFAVKASEWEVCPRCASMARTVYDRRNVCIRDQNIRARRVFLHVQKRRFFCKQCKKPFTEPIPGVLKGYRTTQRFRRHIRWACERFADLKSVSTTYRVSSGFVYSAHYAELEHRRKSRQYPWPSTVALDEHYFKKGPHGGREFVSMVVDYKNKRLFELVEGRRVEQMKHSLKHIEGRDNVKTVVMDMYEPYRAFTKDFFPAATIVADKFHVLRLLSPTINKRRKEITGDKRKHPIRWMLLTNNRKLSRDHRAALFRWLEDKPGIRELYQLKEALHRLYRIRGYDRAKKALGKLMDTMALSKQPEVKTLRNTLKKWTSEILAYFKIRVTNGRTEGYNSKAKLVKKRAYGYKSFNNYRLRLLNACA